MTSVSQKRAAIIAQRLKFLQDQGDQLKSAVDLYVSQIINSGKSWTEGEDNKSGFLEFCQMIDSSVDFLWGKYEELSGGSVSISRNQLSQTFCQQSDTTSQSTTATTSALAISTKQSAASSALTPTQSCQQSTQTVQPIEKNQLKPVLARIAVIEEALCSFQGNIENVAEHQSGTGQQLNELLSQITESDKKHNTLFRKVEEQISEISVIQDAINQDNKKRLHTLEKSLQELSTAQDKLKVDMESQADMTEKLFPLPGHLKSVQENLDILEARFRRIIDDFSNKQQDIENVTRDLADKVMANTDSVKVISEDQEQKMVLLLELRTRLQTLEAFNGRHADDVQKPAETRQDNQVNAIQEVAVLSPRLKPLELASSRSRCGFTAGTSFSRDVGATIKPYRRLYANVGGNFNADSGIFTAPVDGLYVASISLHLRQNEEVLVGVKYKMNDIDNVVCSSSASVINTAACSMGVVEMKAGGILFSHMQYSIKNRKYGYFECPLVNFSCFLLA